MACKCDNNYIVCRCFVQAIYSIVFADNKFIYRLSSCTRHHQICCRYSPCLILLVLSCELIYLVLFVLIFSFSPVKRRCYSCKACGRRPDGDIAVIAGRLCSVGTRQGGRRSGRFCVKFLKNRRKTVRRSEQKGRKNGVFNGRERARKEKNGQVTEGIIPLKTPAKTALQVSPRRHRAAAHRRDRRAGHSPFLPPVWAM